MHQLHFIRILIQDTKKKKSYNNCNSSVDIALGGGQSSLVREADKTHYLMTQKATLEINYDGSKNIIGLFDEWNRERAYMPTQREMTNYALDYK